MRKNLMAVIVSALLLQGCAAGVVAVGAGVTADTATDNRTLGTQLDDQTLDLRVTRALDENKDIWKASSLSVVAQEGQVLIIGQTPTPEMRQQITMIAKGVKGAQKILNEVRLGQPVSLTTRSQDSWITTKIKTQIYTDKTILPGKIKVITENSEVFLIGVVNAKQAKSAVDIARKTSGVTRVVKFFRIVPKSDA
ncbi:division/outer membrane stress-associated lipid-binding lipoprotein [Celerinatantimonas sp. YJH-8]|uniref:division/outer membrane stress-associated lipid-binding lipoprotein n=1 Tax=Celerinatantimonas sp. YJH-8 TaxID=3228714 RepID=UPI0038C1F020